ncbi:aldehyde dehydrogenase family protein [Actinophytocola algeriensis]|uniref:aldehyde dehydrogenase (NAD(+)) n=1 Tax=Actinophytocola algeriensis TaxID=1768010 RepID=A0A7W7Q089_9PSEU|nr:aldehyde dehydrogenase family protein [Actinophytocola algeriensis]MBB4904595.1 aldehyde dehydrogenase (NAD+) [Actinophytocola algeriensis]MBE1476546.1 aldehyde dehydrogenase (NAD+) [Actinophytocola algeriensis]
MAAPTVSTAHFVNGSFTDSSVGGERIDVVNPATEEVIASVPAGTQSDADAAVQAAASAFEAWAATPLSERVAAVGRVNDGLRARAAELAATITAEVGTPIMFSQKVQVTNPVGITAGVLAEIEAGALDPVTFGNSTVVRDPIGVVAAITPWNFPLQQMVAKVTPALVAGNTVVLKPSEVAPLTAGLLAAIIEEAGLPAGVFNMVHGTGPVAGEALAAHPLVDMVSFTGSTRAGRRVAAVGAETIKKIALELGGKSASVVLDDADLARAVKITVANSYMNNGQACSAFTRLLVPADRHDEAIEIAAAAAAKYVPGDPALESTRIGPSVSAAQRDRVVGYIRTGVEEGATLAAGGPDPVEGRGYFVRPTVFGNVTPDMTIAQEEIFGPVLSVMPYTDTDDAVRIANGTQYGLAAGVFGADADRARAVAGRLRAGQVDINGAAFNTKAPFGGVKQSGNGREFGRYGLEEFTELKSIQA